MDEISSFAVLSFVRISTRQSPGRLVGTALDLWRAGERPCAKYSRPGALTWDAAEGIVVNRQHNRAAPIMRDRPGGARRDRGGGHQRALAGHVGG